MKSDIKNKFVYNFRDGNAQQKKMLGGKGANLAEMVQLGIPVPPGFTIATKTCLAYLGEDNQFPQNCWEQILDEIKDLEAQTKKQFGGTKNPLLVSVRSGAPVSMPGMMDTVLNLGLNDQTVESLATITDNPRFAYDAYRRFIQMFSNVVLGIDHHEFEKKLTQYKSTKNFTKDTDLSAEDWQQIIEQYKNLVKEQKGLNFPQDAVKQLKLSIEAVFKSWTNSRAVTYRRIYDIPEDMGTAVNVQAMVFGNLGDTSGTGVLFTRNPSTGEKSLFGEFLLNAQGEDVVAGIRTPQEISGLQALMPKVYDDILAVTKKLESHFKDMQDIEFTIENETLFILQTRSGKRSAAAGLKIAVNLVEEGFLKKTEALLKIEAKGLDQVLHPRIKTGSKKQTLTTGLPASPGAAVGQIAFTSESAEKLSKEGKSVILVRHETSPEDISGMDASVGILTACGGMTSHAAVVARGMGKPCVSGANEITVREAEQQLSIGELTLGENDFISLDGGTGEVILGQCETEPSAIDENFQTVLLWADEIASMRVRANADTPTDATKAREFGAKGIGLCRTEHMFFDEERISAMREMILSGDEASRQNVLAKLLPFQKEDFKGIFKAMDGYPVTIRLLDPPLHEFLPQKDSDIEALSATMNVDFEVLKKQVLNLHEVNPMLGHRGCRLMITFPEIARMQARAISEAACECQKEGILVLPEIMIPLVGLTKELSFLRKEIELVLTEVFMKQKTNVDIKIGTMIEIPRACLVADEIAREADFFSFGTNDLTQMTFGYSRDDVGKFLPEYIDKDFIEQDPFQSLDREGVGKLIRIGVDKGRQTNKDIKIGICGEHGGDPSSIDFCFHQDFNYVSCSPFRVPIARIASAQSYIRKWGPNR